MNQVNRITRIVIMADNQVGAIADIATVLADAGVNLESINTQENNRQGAVIITTDASTCSRPYLRVQLPHPQASQRWKLLKEPEEDSREILQEKPQGQECHQSRAKPPGRARPLPSGRQEAETDRV